MFFLHFWVKGRSHVDGFPRSGVPPFQALYDSYDVTNHFVSHVIDSVQFVTEKVNGSDSLDVNNDGAICTVGPPLTSPPGHYNGSCVAANELVGWANIYTLTMSIRDHTNTTVLVQSTNYIMFGVGKLSVLP